MTVNGEFYINDLNVDFYLRQLNAWNKKGKLVRYHVLGMNSEPLIGFTSFQHFELALNETPEHYFNGLSDVLSSVRCIHPTAASCDLTLTDDLAAFLRDGSSVVGTAHFEGVTQTATLDFADRLIPARTPLWLVMPEVPDIAMAGLRCLFVSEPV